MDKSPGQAMLETALIIPLVMLAAVGVMQFALWMHAESIVTAAAQDGARIASSETGTPGQGLAAARSLLHDGLGPNAAFVQVVPSEDASTVRFEATGSLPAIFPWGPMTTIPLHASASMARDRFIP
jgi:Flp pilus assembly protein TadG